MSKKVKKKYSVIDTMEKDKDTGDARFKRYEYWGIGSCYLVHYVGDLLDLYQWKLLYIIRLIN